MCPRTCGALSYTQPRAAAIFAGPIAFLQCPHPPTPPPTSTGRTKPNLRLSPIYIYSQIRHRRQSMFLFSPTLLLVLLPSLLLSELDRHRISWAHFIAAPLLFSSHPPCVYLFRAVGHDVKSEPKQGLHTSFPPVPVSPVSLCAPR